MTYRTMLRMEAGGHAVVKTGTSPETYGLFAVRRRDFFGVVVVAPDGTEFTLKDHRGDGEHRFECTCEVHGQVGQCLHSQVADLLLGGIDRSQERQLSFWIEASDPAFGGTDRYSATATSLHEVVARIQRDSLNHQVVATDEATKERFVVKRDGSIELEARA